MSVPATSPPSSIDSRGDTITHGAAAGGLATIDSPTCESRPLPSVPGFRIVRWLGGGGMGDVFEAVDEKLNVTFALKMVRPDRLSPGFAARFRNEARSMAGLDHPNVARIFGYGEVDGLPYFTMRFIRGGTLADRAPDLRADPKGVVRLLIKVIDAVEYLHQQDQVHRDLKPANILVDESGEPYLSDFGLVKDLADLNDGDDSGPTSPAAAASTAPDLETQSAMPRGVPANTRTGMRIGTYAYMSPEQARGEVRRIGPASDVWALGVILYELLTGVRPDRDAALSAPGIDVGLDRIVLKCLSHEPAERYPSAAALAADLRAWLAPAVRTRRRWLMVAIVLLVVGGAITLAILRPSRRDDAKPEEWREWARKELQAGRPVTLVDNDGNPAAGFRFVAGSGPEKAERDPAGWWRVSTTAATLAELLDDPGIDYFTLSGEFRGHVTGGLPEAGLYVSSRRVPAGGEINWFYQLEYFYKENSLNLAIAEPAKDSPPAVPAPLPPNAKVYAPDKKELRGQPRVPLREVRFHGGPISRPGGNPEGGRSWPVENDRREPGGPWRRLTIHARNEAFAVSWDDGNEYIVPQLSAAQTEKLQHRGALAWSGPALEFTARGGIGVIVKGGSAAVRNVIISPGSGP